MTIVFSGLTCAICPHSEATALGRDQEPLGFATLSHLGGVAICITASTVLRRFSQVVHYSGFAHGLSSEDRWKRVPFAHFACETARVWLDR